MMSGKPAKPQKKPREQGTRHGPNSSFGSKKIKEYKRCPDCPIHHLRGHRIGDVAAEAVHAAGENRGCPGAAQIPGQRVTSEGGEISGQDEVPMQGGLPYPTVL